METDQKFFENDDEAWNDAIKRTKSTGYTKSFTVRFSEINSRWVSESVPFRIAQISMNQGRHVVPSTDYDDRDDR